MTDEYLDIVHLYRHGVVVRETCTLDCNSPRIIAALNHLGKNLKGTIRVTQLVRWHRPGGVTSLRPTMSANVLALIRLH